jgi:hypothetical protein
MAHDAVFVHLCGGYVPSVDILYDDLGRFGPEELVALEELMASKTLACLRTQGRHRQRILHVDIDTTVTPMFGVQEGALPGSKAPSENNGRSSLRMTVTSRRPGVCSSSRHGSGVA